MIRRYPKDSLEGRLQPLCAEHWLYRATVRSVKTELGRLHQLSYTAEELWGDCICELDRYRQDRPLYRSRCPESLLDFYNQICRRGKSFSEEHDRECKRLTGLFAAMLMLVFHRTQQNQGTLVMLNLMRQCKKMDIDYREMYDKLTYESDQYGYEQFTSQITEYLDGNVFLSEKIVETIEEMEKATRDRQQEGQESNGPSLPKSDLKIAKGKLSRVLTVLDTMIQSGWIVNEKDDRPRNRERALNQILQTAFGEERDRDINSTMYPSNRLENREEFFQKIINELLTTYKSNLP